MAALWISWVDQMSLCNIECQAQYLIQNSMYSKSPTYKWIPLQYFCLENPMDGGAW